MEKDKIVIDDNGVKRHLTDEEYKEYMEDNRPETTTISLTKRVECVEAAMREMLMMIGGKENV